MDFSNHHHETNYISLNIRFPHHGILNFSQADSLKRHLISGYLPFWQCQSPRVREVEVAWGSVPHTKMKQTASFPAAPLRYLSSLAAFASAKSGFCDIRNWKALYASPNCFAHMCCKSDRADSSSAVTSLSATTTKLIKCSLSKMH